MKKINDQKIKELQSLIKTVKLKTPETTILELTEMRTSKIEELSSAEAEALINRLKKFNEPYQISIKDV